MPCPACRDLARQLQKARADGQVMLKKSWNSPLAIIFSPLPPSSSPPSTIMMYHPRTWPHSPHRQPLLSKAAAGALPTKKSASKVGTSRGSNPQPLNQGIGKAELRKLKKHLTLEGAAETDAAAGNSEMTRGLQEVKPATRPRCCVSEGFGGGLATGREFCDSHPLQCDGSRGLILGNDFGTMSFVWPVLPECGRVLLV